MLFRAAAIAFLVSAAGQTLLCLLAGLPLRRLRADVHWTERARRSWSLRLIVGWGPVVLAFLAWNNALVHGGACEQVLLVLAAMTGASLASVWIMRQLLQRQYTLRDRLGDYLFVYFVRVPALPIYAVTAILLAIHPLGWPAAAIMLAGFLLALWTAYGALLPFLRAVGLLRAASEALRQIIEGVALRAGAPPPQVYLLQWSWANALAFPHHARAIAFTPAMASLLDADELAAVAAHEIAHLTESRRQKLMRLSGLLFTYPIAITPVWLHYFGSNGLFIPLLALALGVGIMRGFSQKMEKRADAAAEKHADARAFATGLEKGYRFNLVPAVLRGKRQTHPHLYDRLIAAGAQPDYSRPKPPVIWPALLLLLPLICLAPVMNIYHPLFPDQPKPHRPAHIHRQ